MSEDMNKKDEEIKEAGREVVENEDARPQSNLYQDLEGTEKETNVEVPTDDAVEDIKEWVDEENRR